MKIYDKEIYKKQENIKGTVLIIVVFLLGFFVGYMASSFNDNKTEDTNTQNQISTQVGNII